MQKQNEYDNKRKKTLRWGYLFAVVALCVFVMFLARIVIHQNTNVQEIKDDYIHKNYRKKQAMQLLKYFFQHPFKTRKTSIKKITSLLYYIPITFLHQLRLNKLAKI